jgi:nitrile hydratase accessory protein
VYDPSRNIVVRSDGRRVNVARYRGQLFVCASGCCCGRTEDGFAPVSVETLHHEWERRGLRNVVHLTIGGCLGPCALANVALLIFDGQAQWFHSIDSAELAQALYDHVERMLDTDTVLAPGGDLAARLFTASSWQPRSDGRPVDDARVWRVARGRDRRPACVSGVSVEGAPLTVDQVMSRMEGRAALPRRNGELVFEEPWQGRAFGMAIALHEHGAYEWEEFRQALIDRIAAAERRGGPFVYYEIWLETFESLLSAKGLVTPDELDETTYQFEFGERDDVF